MADFKIYQKFEEDDIIVGRNNTISTGFFPGDLVYISQSSFRTSSAQVQLTGSLGEYDILSGLYYTNVYDSITDPHLLFSVSYGDINGGGVKTGSVISHTAAVYTQYKNVLLGTADVDGLFSFKSGSTYISSSEIYVISFASDLMKDQIDRAQWQISISGSGGEITLVDETPLLTTAEKKEQRLVYEVIQGAYDETTGVASSNYSHQGIGLFYPKNGIIILNAKTIQTLTGINYDSGSSAATEPVNHRNLYNGIRNSTTKRMRVRRSEIVPSTHYYVRVKNRDFNFSNNPTFVYQTTTDVTTRGEIISSLQSDPNVYITTVGLYNDLNELVAVAKLSQPTKKNFQNELLLRIRLDW